ncbi:MAG TPA: hypothetical protein P5257_09580 [Bacteroidales bacterium]|nr:hypothetical protein [Bacteroidales bacterium]HRT90354.1 hypothetical protein [Bacteroidales bacterium]
MKIRAIILIIATLIIGFVLGMLVSAQIRYARLKPVMILFSEERFREGFFRMLQPDDQQEKTITQILSKYAKLNTSIQSDFRRKTDSLMKELWKEIEPNLTKEQIERLKEAEQRRLEMIKRSWRLQGDSSRFRQGPGQRPDGPWQGPRRDMSHPPDFDRRMPPRTKPDTAVQPAI